MTNSVKIICKRVIYCKEESLNSVLTCSAFTLVHSTVNGSEPTTGHLILTALPSRAEITPSTCSSMCGGFPVGESKPVHKLNIVI